MNSALNEYLKQLCSLPFSHVLLTGDFNYSGIDWTNWTTKSHSIHSAEFQFLESCRDQFLYQHVDKPTQGRQGEQQNVLYLIFTNEEGMVSDVNYLSPLGASDH